MHMDIILDKIFKHLKKHFNSGLGARQETKLRSLSKSNSQFNTYLFQRKCWGGLNK